MVKEINLFDLEMETLADPLTEPDMQDPEIIESVKQESTIKKETIKQSAIKDAPKSKKEEPSLPGILDNIRNQQREQAQEKFLRQHAKKIIEALLFASADALSFTRIREILDTFHPLKPRLVRDLILELQQDYLAQQRAFRIEEIADGFLLRTCEEYSEFISLLFRNKRLEKLSQASAEVLAIIAYKQPVARPQIEAIRGVDCSGIVQNLLERQLIEPVGRLEAPGRPTLYSTTKNFLQHFGLKDAQELSS